jgi:hypothetical protein
MRAEGLLGVILSKDRDPRFVTIRRGGTLTDSDHQLLAFNNATRLGDTPPGNVSAYDPSKRQWVGLPTASFGCASYPATWIWTGRAALLYCARPLPA